MVTTTENRKFKTVITGTGMGLPKKILTNQELEKMVDTSDEWIVQRSGIKERRILSGDETLASLSVKATNQALEMASLKAEDLDMIIVATQSPDMLLPSAACYLQEHLGLTSCPAFDIVAGCTGWLYAMVIADRFIQARPDSNILVVGAEVITRRVDWEDRATCVLFGDGAGATIMTGSNNGTGLLGDNIKADGTQWDLLKVEGGGSLHPPSHEMVDAGLQYLRMQGKQVFKYAVPAMSEAIIDLLDKLGYSADDVDYVIPHQANARILEAVAKKIGLPMDKMHVTLHKYGNISTASIPVAMHEAVEEGKIKKGDLVIMVSFGGGFTWGAALYQF